MQTIGILTVISAVWEIWPKVAKAVPVILSAIEHVTKSFQPPKRVVDMTPEEKAVWDEARKRHVIGAVRALVPVEAIPDSTLNWVIETCLQVKMLLAKKKKPTTPAPVLPIPISAAALVVLVAFLSVGCKSVITDSGKVRETIHPAAKVALTPVAVVVGAAGGAVGLPLGMWTDQVYWNETDSKSLTRYKEDVDKIYRQWEIGEITLSERNNLREGALRTLVLSVMLERKGKL